MNNIIIKNITANSNGGMLQLKDNNTVYLKNITIQNSTAYLKGAIIYAY